VIKTKRYNDPVDPRDGFLLLVCRYRPRGVKKEDETWDAWDAELGPSRQLHADFYGKNGPPIDYGDYVKRYLAEMKKQTARIDALAARVKAGETITLLCSSACTDPKKCHRTLLKELITRSMETTR
jgi:uncharacterized protein YeaO (DUF488 family)